MPLHLKMAIGSLDMVIHMTRGMAVKIALLLLTISTTTMIQITPPTTDTQFKIRPLPSPRRRTSMLFPRRDRESHLIGTCSRGSRNKPSVARAGYPRLAEQSHSLTCAIRRRRCSRWLAIFPLFQLCPNKVSSLMSLVPRGVPLRFTRAGQDMDQGYLPVRSLTGPVLKLSHIQPDLILIRCLRIPLLFALVLCPAQWSTSTTGHRQFETIVATIMRLQPQLSPSISRLLTKWHIKWDLRQPRWLRTNLLQRKLNLLLPSMS